MSILNCISLAVNIINRLKTNKNKILVLFGCVGGYCMVLRYFSPDPLIPDHLRRRYLYHFPSNVKDFVIPDLTSKLEKMNRQRVVRNTLKFGPVDVDTVIIVVTVHRDTKRLPYLITSLAQVQAISTALLIFSHSYYDENINHLVELIDFCLVLQIYFPNSVQVNPDIHVYSDPGNDKESKLNLRNATMSQRKHHWWWTAHLVFEELPWAKVHKQMVMFISEDSYVLPDCLYMLQFAKRALSYFPEAVVLSFGRSLAKDLEYNKLTVDAWRPPYDRGVAFNATTWRAISSLRAHFCEYDDTSWSYSLLSVFEQFPRGRALMVACMAPRVVSTAMFHSGWHAALYLRMTLDSRLLFPPTVRTAVLFGGSGKMLRTIGAPRTGNGGWTDSRDRFMCYDPLTITDTVNYLTTTSPIFTTD